MTAQSSNNATFLCFSVMWSRLRLHMSFSKVLLSAPSSSQSSIAAQTAEGASARATLAAVRKLVAAVCSARRVLRLCVVMSGRRGKRLIDVSDEEEAATPAAAPARVSRRADVAKDANGIA